MPKSAEPVRRLEVFTGAGRRRRWSAEEKARIVAESYADDESVCSVARRHGLTPQQLFTWRRQARHPVTDLAVAPVMFVPAVVEAPAAPELAPERKQRPGKVGRAAGLIEVEIDGVTVRVGRGAEAKTIAAVIRALKAGS